VIGVAVIVVEGVELLEAAFLAREELDDHHPGERLLQVGVEARDALADQAIRPPRREAEEIDAEEEHGHEHERRRREARVDRHHDDDDPHHREDVHEDRHRARREHLVQHVDVRREPRHQTADRVAVEVAHRQPLDVGEHLDAEVGEAPLRDQHGQVVLGVEGHALADDRRDVEETHVAEAARVARRHVVVDRELQDVRLRQHAGRVHRETRHREPEEPPVRAQEPPQTADQPRVVGLAERFFLVRIEGLAGIGGDGPVAARPQRRDGRPLHSASSSSASRCRRKRSA
jgi:hypothetical protein